MDTTVDYICVQHTPVRNYPLINACMTEDSALIHNVGRSSIIFSFVIISVLLPPFFKGIGSLKPTYYISLKNTFHIKVICILDLFRTLICKPWHSVRDAVKAGQFLVERVPSVPIYLFQKRNEVFAEPLLYLWMGDTGKVVVSIEEFLH